MGKGFQVGSDYDDVRLHLCCLVVSTLMTQSSQDQKKDERRCPLCYEKLYWKPGEYYCKGVNKETGKKCEYRLETP